MNINLCNELQSLIVNFEGGFESFCRRYHLRYRYHSCLPLVVVTYDNRYQSDNQNEQHIMDECRGIVFETVTWKVISKSFTRFFKCPPSKNFNDLTIEVKEDGSFLNLFCYNDQWILATRNNFADDLVHDESMTYTDLFETILGLNLNEIGSLLNPKITYSFEVCSKHNRIVKNYDQPKIFLLGCFLEGAEISIDKIVFESISKINPIESFHFKSLTFGDAEKLLNERVQSDPLFEGFVIKYTNTNNPLKRVKRVKLKNPLYMLVHNLKYRGWRMINRDVVNKINTQYHQHIDAIFEVFKHGRSFVDFNEYVVRFQDNRCSQPSRHSNTYCYLSQMGQHHQQQNNGLASIVPYFDKLKQKWHVQCYCGKQMKLLILKTDRAIYKTCPVCDLQFDLLVYANGTLLWVCSDTTCPLTHQAHQKNFSPDVKRGQPTGIPCSSFCKDLRLSVHQLMSAKKISHKDLARILSIDESKTHMSLFGISECVDAIKKMLNDTN